MSYRRLQLRRGKKADMPTLAVGEIAFTTDENKLYVGDGTTNHCVNPSDTIIADTLSASVWSNGVYSFESTYPASIYDLEVALNSTATTAQAEAFNGAQIVGSATSNIIKAYGGAPTIDIPIILKVVTK